MQQMAGNEEELNKLKQEKAQMEAQTAALQQ
jgi:hypothetical protein